MLAMGQFLSTVCGFLRSLATDCAKKSAGAEPLPGLGPGRGIARSRAAFVAGPVYLDIF
jgi:hypothetical protein